MADKFGFDEDCVKVSVGELGAVITGNTPSKSNDSYWNSADICFVKPDGIGDEGITFISGSNEYISEDAREKVRVVTKDSIFVTCIGSIGKIGIAEEGEFAFNQQINVIVPNDRVIPKYLAYNLLHNKLRLYAIANSAVVPIINKSQFSEFELSIVEDKVRQRNIVDNMDLVAKIIENRKCQLEELDTLIKARFVEMFGDPLVNPMGWKVENFENISSLITDGEHATPRRVNEGIFLLSARNVLNHSIQVNDVDYIDEEEYQRIAKRVVPQEGDVLISCSGSIGRCCVVPKNFRFQMVRSAALIRFNDEVNPVFAEWLITSDALQRQIMQAATQSSQANLFQGKIRQLQGYVPPIELQNQFADFVTQVDKLRVEVQKSLDEFQTIFDSLMQQYFG